MPEDAFEFDLAISFAAEERAVAEDLAKRLRDKGITVFPDEYTQAATRGDDAVDHLVNLYARKARYCVLLISRHYPLRQWTDLERTHAQERALREADRYILLLQVDDHQVPGVTANRGCHDLRQTTLQGVADWLETKLAESMPGSSPPPQSHDLRSGNVPSASSPTEGK